MSEAMKYRKKPVVVDAFQFLSLADIEGKPGIDATRVTESTDSPRWEADDPRGMSDGAIQVLVGDLRVALMAVTDALDREKLARDLHERFAPPWLDHWDDLDETERETTEAWDVADVVRRHVLGEEPNHG